MGPRISDNVKDNEKQKSVLSEILFVESRPICRSSAIWKGEKQIGGTDGKSLVEQGFVWHIKNRTE